GGGGGGVRRPGGGPRARPAAVTARNAVWCHRYSVIADRLAVATAAHASGRRIHRASGSRSSSARPAWAIPKVTAARVGGFRFEMAAPLTPTMLAGYPAQATSAAVAAAPPASISAGIRQPRNDPRAHAMPSRYGTSQPAITLIQPSQAGPPSPNRTRSTAATTAAGTQAAQAPRRRPIAMASGASPTARAHPPGTPGGPTTTRSGVPRAAPGPPATLSPTGGGPHPPASPAPGRDSRASRARSQAR